MSNINITAIKYLFDTVSQLLNTGEALDIKLVYRFKRIIQKAFPIIKKLDSKRMELWEKYAVETEVPATEEGQEPTKTKQVPEESKKAWMDEFQAFLGEDVKWDADAIPYDLLENSHLKVTVQQLYYLEPFITGAPEDFKDEIETGLEEAIKKADEVASQVEEKAPVAEEVAAPVEG